ncbi:hypothetical protein GCM10009555_074460 [Acrocarpospora macrocephala]|uniref:Uncharacterized protein n=1 Tax=Acrocarpospora macrocephala TaxID=150177 RepID=A0A5M3WQ47_9ACTN|nr:hypothetical protein [Acrocarpospora macrocephala]GES11395.1 hypothetical protein Amac_049920 [Acrocarpospora macrocephala]
MTHPPRPPQPPYAQPYGPPPSYHQPPKPHSRWPLIIVLVIVLPLAVIGGCMALVFSVGSRQPGGMGEHTITFEVSKAETDSTAATADLTWQAGSSSGEERGVTLPYKKDVKVIGVVPRVSMQATS